MDKSKFSITTHYITNLSKKEHEQVRTEKPVTVEYELRELKSFIPFGYHKGISKMVNYQEVNLEKE
jgi:hypothetical protein